MCEYVYNGEKVIIENDIITVDEEDTIKTEYLEKVYKFLQKRYSKKEGEKRNELGKHKS